MVLIHLRDSDDLVFKCNQYFGNKNYETETETELRLVLSCGAWEVTKNVHSDRREVSKQDISSEE